VSRKRKKYSPDFKAKVVLELLEGNKTINEIASKYEMLPKTGLSNLLCKPNF
jgi:putative transposase